MTKRIVLLALAASFLVACFTQDTTSPNVNDSDETKSCVQRGGKPATLRTYNGYRWENIICFAPEVLR